jgi:broad specificity phosphatase PhoE
MSSTVHVVRHGEVHNPDKILYGRQPGWRLSDRGQEMASTIGEWSKTVDLGALHVSPLQLLPLRTILLLQLMND